MKKNLILIGILVVLVGAYFVSSSSEKKSERAHIQDDMFMADSAAIMKLLDKEDSTKIKAILEGEETNIVDFRQIYYELAVEM